MTTTSQPGWYDDPQDANSQRYWDGQDWTPRRQRKPVSGSTPPSVASAQPQASVYTQSPAASYTQPPSVALGAQQDTLPNSHLVWAVFSIFYCFPFGIIAIINATKVSNLWALGQYDAARAAAKSARQYAMWGMIAFAVLWGGGFLFWVVIFVIGASMGTSTS
jgi:hypothetical protein